MYHLGERQPHELQLDELHDDGRCWWTAFMVKSLVVELRGVAARVLSQE